MPHGAERRRFEPNSPAAATPGAEVGRCVIRRLESRDRGRIGGEAGNFVPHLIRKLHGTRIGSDRSARTAPSCGLDCMLRDPSGMSSP